MKVTVAMLGARSHYAVPRLLHEAGLLERFFTDSYVGNKPCLEAALRAVPKGIAPRGLLRWLGRKDAVLPPELVESFDVLGLWYAYARNRARAHPERQAVYREAARRFNRAIRRAGLGDAQIVWGFNNASLELFQAARAQDKRCVLEQTILPLELEFRLMQEEIARWPGWQPDLELGELDRRSVRRAREEWALADCIVAGSNFVRTGLETCGVPAGKIRVVPYGVDVARFGTTEPRIRTDGAPLRVLFAGEVGLRKGVPDLLQALAELGNNAVQARFAGTLALAPEHLARFSGVASFLGPVPRPQMPALYQWADVFVLPSIVEGSATVTYEALLSGVPVITTPNAGSIVEEGVNGFVVPIRDHRALVEAIGRYAQDRDLLARHHAACVEGRERAGLDRYRTNLTAVISSLSLGRLSLADEPRVQFR